MPLQDLGNGCYRWGDNGKKYCGPGAKKRAMQQAVAIEKSKQDKGEPSEFDKAEAIYNEILQEEKDGKYLTALKKRFGDDEE